MRSRRNLKDLVQEALDLGILVVEPFNEEILEYAIKTTKKLLQNEKLNKISKEINGDSLEKEEDNTIRKEAIKKD